MLDEVKLIRNAKEGILTITARNMIPTPETFSLKLLNYKGHGVSIDGHAFSIQEIEAGIPLEFKALETRTIHVKE